MRIGEGLKRSPGSKILPGCSRCRSDLEQEPNRAGDSGAGVRFCVDLVGCVIARPDPILLFIMRWQTAGDGIGRVRDPSECGVLMLLEKLDQTLPIREFIQCVYLESSHVLPPLLCG